MAMDQQVDGLITLCQKNAGTDTFQLMISSKTAYPLTQK